MITRPSTLVTMDQDIPHNSTVYLVKWKYARHDIITRPHGYSYQLSCYCLHGIQPWKCVLPRTYRNGSRHPSWASYQIRKIAGCACTGNVGNDFPHGRLQRKPLASDPDIHHGMCMTHVPWCMSGSLTRGGGENVPGIPGACAPAILRIWQEAHCTNSPSNTETGIFWENSVDAMPIEAQSPCVDTPSVAIALKIQDNRNRSLSSTSKDVIYLHHVGVELNQW